MSSTALPRVPAPGAFPAGPAPTSLPHCFSPASFWSPLHVVESAWLEHAPFAFWLVEALQPRSLVELGTHNGYSFLTFCQAVQRLGLPTACYAVDTWEGDEHAGFYGGEVHAELSATVERHYAGFTRLLRCRFDQALPYFADGSIDLLHIDGRHTFEDVREDFESWRPKLSRRAVVLFHDTNVRERNFGVWRFWEDLSQQHPNFEFLHGHGLGVLAVGPEVPDGLRALLGASPEEVSAIRAAYAHLGHGATHQFQLEVTRRQLGQAQAAEATQAAAHQAHRLAAQAEADQLRRSLAAQQAEAEQLRGEAERLRDSLAAEQAALRAQAEHWTATAQAQAERWTADLSAQQAASQAEIEALRAANQDSGAALALARDEASRLERQAAELREQAEEQHRTLQELRQALAEREAMQADLQSAFAAVMAQVSQSEQSLAELRQSTLWRLTGPLREGLTRMPQPLRLTLRRFAKATWWAATPHRMPQRLAFLKARRELLAANLLSTPVAPAAALEIPPETTQEAAPAPLMALAPAAAAPAHLAFHPAPPGSGPDRMADRNGRYALEAQDGGYIYVPPAPPPDLDRRLAALPRRPHFSIVVPTYNTTTDLLSRLLASVKAQWYPDWTLILADDASPKAETRDFLRGLDDPRYHVMLLEKNSGISGATNAAIEQAKGDYVVFLDHDDELTEDCLWELALRIAQDDPDFLYSDEDKIDEQGRFCQPFFKPDWSPDTMMSTMFTCHVSCVRRSLLREVGPLNSEFDGSQDWDLILRVTERARRIAHIPKVLYHWRIIPSSVAADISAKPYAVLAGQRCREAAMQRRGTPGRMEPVEQMFGYFRARYDVRGNPLISIIIPSRNNGAVLRRCVDSIDATSSWRNFEFIILDNGSDQAETLGILKALEQRDGTRVIRHDAPFNYSELNNIGARAARGEILLFLNDDTELLTPDGLERMAGYAQQSHIAAVGAKLLYPETRRVQHSGLINLACGPCHALHGETADAFGNFMRNLLEYNWVAVTGACMMIERGKFEAAGGFDETFPVSYNDVDLCFRLLKQGLYHVVCPSVHLLHHESLSRGQDHEVPERRARLDADRYRLYAAHPDMLMHDPFHNPNLHPENVHFAVPA
ncbi:glycosyltransferase [Teichococcus aerofrigidensis]